MEREGTFIPTRRLVAFLAVLEHGGVSRAAERLGVRQPTVSGLIRSLERDVGTDLFVRRPGPLRPTAAGTALATHAARLLRVVEEAQEAVARADRDARRHLAIAAGEALATHVLPPAVARLRERLPGLTVEFVVGDEARVVEALRSGEVDAALLTDRTEARDLELHDYASGPADPGRRTRRTGWSAGRASAGATWPARRWSCATRARSTAARSSRC